MKRRLLVLLLPILAFANAKAQTVTIWEDHEDAFLGVSAGYVAKEWSTDFYGDTYSENLWGEEGKMFHGFQLGVFFQPCFKWGLGLYTGLFYESYISLSAKMSYDKFTEHGAYLPLHMSYRLPLGRETSITLRGGLGLNFALYGKFRDFGYEDEYGDYYGPEDYQLKYGRDGWPKHFNAQLEMALSFRYKDFQISASYSKGLTDHEFYRADGNFKTYQNKIGVSVAWVLTWDDVFAFE